MTGIYLRIKYDAFILAIDNNSKSKIEKFQQKEILITIISIITVLLEVIFIFIPIIEKIKKQNEQFRTIAYNQSHVIRQPLANIKGLLYFIDCTKVDEDIRSLLGLAKSEAEKLDTIIKNNVSNTTEI